MKYLIVCLLMMLSIGCANPQQEINEQQLEVNNIQIDNANIDWINECSENDFACDGWKCLCERISSKDNKKEYCDRYQDYCVDNKYNCEEKEIGNISFVSEVDFWDKGCPTKQQTIIIRGIELDEIIEGEYNLLVGYVKKSDMEEWHIQTITYRKGKFYDWYGTEILVGGENI